MAVSDKFRQAIVKVFNVERRGAYFVSFMDKSGRFKIKNFCSDFCVIVIKSVFIIVSYKYYSIIVLLFHIYEYRI